MLKFRRLIPTSKLVGLLESFPEAVSSRDRLVDAKGRLTQRSRSFNNNSSFCSPNTPFRPIKPTMARKSKKKRSFQQFSESPKATNAKRPFDSPLPALPELPKLPEFKLSGPDEKRTDGDASDGGWQEVKRPKKMKERSGNSGPSFQMSPMRIKHKLKVKELQELCLWLLSAGKGPQWLIVNVRFPASSELFFGSLIDLE